MDIAGDEEEEIRMPISTNFTESSRLKMLATSLPAEDKSPAPKKNVKYRECLKNHAANLGGHITDGCGEFMPSGEEGTLDYLKCAACECHRNFHRREVEGEPPQQQAPPSCDCYHDRMLKRPGSSLVPLAFPRPPPQMIMALNTGPAAGLVPSDADDQEGNFLSPPSALRKRFRTKFSQEQKDRMLAFADKIGWRIQKHDEAAVQQFCQEVGVKRHVLKVWMHNNKHTLGKAHAHADSSNNNNTATNSSSN